MASAGKSNGLGSMGFAQGESRRFEMLVIKVKSSGARIGMPEVKRNIQDDRS